MSKLLLIDGNSLTYRAYYGSAYSGVLTNSNGTPINAVLTLFKMLNKAIGQIEPTHLLIAFDKGPKTHRHEKLDSYKAGRQKTPEELIIQFPIVKEMIEKMCIRHHEEDLIEADDIIGTLANMFSEQMEVVVLSSDKDLLQLVNDNISVSLPQNGANENIIITNDIFFDKYSHNPNQVPDFKGLVGDSSDNLPGVRGIGEVGANKMLNEYKTLENIYKNIESFSNSIQEKLINDKESAFLCKELATLLNDVNIPYSIEDLRYSWNINDELIEFFKKYELNSLLKKYGAQKPKKVQKDTEKTGEQISFDKLLFD